MGFKSASDYEKAASDVINNPKALHKTEKEDGDTCYYIEETNEFVVLSKDGYIRTYFLPSAGKAYYDRQ
jgi:pyocin large subunit-like protein